MKGGKMPWEGEKIKGLAKEKNITLIKLAEQIGVSRQAVNDWINGKVPKGNHLVAMCRILFVSPEIFFSDDSSRTISIPVHRTRKRAKCPYQLTINKNYESLQKVSLKRPCAK